MLAVVKEILKSDVLNGKAAHIVLVRVIQTVLIIVPVMYKPDIQRVFA